MDEKTIRSKHDKSRIIALLALLLAVAMFLLSRTYGDEGLLIGQDKYNTLKSGWRVSTENAEWMDVDLPYQLDVSAGETYYSSYTFSQDDLGSMMRIRASMQDVSVYIDGALIFQGLKPDRDSFVVPNASVWYFVELPGDLDGKTMTLEWTAQEEAFAGTLNEVVIGQGNALLYNLQRSHMPYVFITIFLLIFGTVPIIAAVFFSSFRKSQFVWLGLFAWSMGTWIFSEARLMQLITGNWFIIGGISYMSLALMPGFFLLFLKNLVFRGYQKILTGVAGVYFLSFFLNLGLQLTGVAGFFTTIKVTNSLTGVAALALIYMLWKEGFRYQNVAARKMLSHFLIFAAVILLEIIQFLTGNYQHISSFSSFGVVLFFAFLGRDSLLNFNEIVGKERERQFLQKIAYMDMLTGGKNRAAFERDTNLLTDENPDRNFRLVFLDINNLKVINDTFGHAEGDKLIKTCYGILEETFGNCGEIYRLGGDEFACLMMDTDIRTFNHYYEDLQVKSKVLQDWEPFPVEIAIGSDVFFACRKEGFIDFYHRVDQLMYKNKRKLKESMES